MNTYNRIKLRENWKIWFLFMLCGHLSLLTTTASPKWVKLLHENKYYFKTIEKVEKYWEHHYKPMELEEDKPQQLGDPRRWITKIFQSQETAKTKSNDLLIDYKYFKRWKFEMEPFVKNDGTIMTEDERIAAWEQANNHK